MPTYRNDRADLKTIFAGGKPIRYGEEEPLDQYVYDPDLVLTSHVPVAKALDPNLSKIDILIEGDLGVISGEVQVKAGPFNMQDFEFGPARSFGLLVKAGGPGTAKLTVNVHAARAEGSGESWPFQTPVVPISGEAPTDFYRTFDLEQVDAIVFLFDSDDADSTITEAQLII